MMGEITEERLREFGLEMRGGRKRRRWLEERVLLVGLNIDEITQMEWLRFMEKIISNGYDVVLYAFFNL